MTNVFEAGYLADVERRTVSSISTGTEHDIYISKPASYGSADGPYPLLIVLDANYGFATAAESSRMQAATGESAEMFIVGLGTPGGLAQHGVRRIRDYTPGFGPSAPAHGETSAAFHDLHW